MYTCSNTNCRAQYSNPTANELKGECKKCGQALADEKGIGWRHYNPQKKAAPTTAGTAARPQAVPSQTHAQPPGGTNVSNEGKKEGKIA